MIHALIVVVAALGYPFGFVFAWVVGGWLDDKALRSRGKRRMDAPASERPLSR